MYQTTTLSTCYFGTDKHVSLGGGGGEIGKRMSQKDTMTLINLLLDILVLLTFILRDASEQLGKKKSLCLVIGSRTSTSRGTLVVRRILPFLFKPKDLFPPIFLENRFWGRLSVLADSGPFLFFFDDDFDPFITIKLGGGVMELGEGAWIP